MTSQGLARRVAFGKMMLQLFGTSRVAKMVARSVAQRLARMMTSQHNDDIIEGDL